MHVPSEFTSGQVAMLEVPGLAYTFDLVKIAYWRSDFDGPKPFWISKTEVTWDLFDSFVYGLDQPEQSTGGADAVTRPTKPYLPPDRGFGHEGFAAISMSHDNATEFCRWLSAKTGRHFRLPTEDEWEYACMAKDPGTQYCFYWSGDDYGISNGEAVDDIAWFAGNAEGVPHAVGTKLPNAWGFHDMHGNVAEWVDGRDGQPVIKGGSYRDSAEKLKVSARVPYNRAWNAGDPQIPKSQWWLADAPFIGFRVVCDDAEVASVSRPATTQPQRASSGGDTK